MPRISTRLSQLDRDMAQLETEFQNLRMDIVLLQYPIGGQAVPQDVEEQIGARMARLNAIRMEREQIFEEMKYLIVRMVAFVEEEAFS